MKPKRRVILRVTPINRLSFPVLLNAWEENGIDEAFEITIREQPLRREDLKPGDVLLYSLMTSTLPEIHAEIKELKNRDILLVAGGPHITGDQELPFKMGFDTLFTGPAERTFLEFGKDLLDSRPIKDIYRYEHNPESYRDFIRYLPLSKYMVTMSPLEIMRGCTWNCSYCRTHMGEVFYRDIHSIDTYLKTMKQRDMLRINFISPSSMEFGADRPRGNNLPKIREVLELSRFYRFRFIEYGIFPSEIRPDTVTVEGMKLLKQYVSNKSVTIGAQSSLDSRLKDLKRGHTAADIEKAAAAANEGGFSVTLDFIVGYPDETREERQENIRFIKRLSKEYRLKTHIHFFIPLPGSAYGNRLPSFLSEEEKDELHFLRTAGISREGWVSNEQQAHRYLNWLKDNFPEYYSRFH